MINVSREFKQHMAEDDRKFLVYLDITLRNGTKLDTLDNSDIWEGGFKLDDGVTPSGQFTIGSCIINKLTVTLNNIYDKFSTYDFDGAVVEAYLGLRLSEGKVEKIKKGTYTVDEPSYNGSTITLECLDNMMKFDVEYSKVGTSYPASLREIVMDICVVCGMTLKSGFNNDGYIVKSRPEDDALSCRDVLVCCAQLACGFGRCDVYGRLEIKWFDQEVFEKNANLDGGIFDEATPQYDTGDIADGGDFNNYSSGYTADGGSFDDLNEFHHIYSMSGFNVCTDDVVITGVEVTEEFPETEKDKRNTVLVGSKGYVLSISGNKLIQKGDAGKVAQYLGNRLIGLRFRPMSTQAMENPTIEAGDLAYVTDRKQNSYNCLITNLTFNLGGYMSISCDAETPSKNSSKSYTELTKAIVEARKNAQAQISEYDIAVQMLTSLITQSFGVYKTDEKLEDGSVIYYMHDKPTLKESKSIWKMTANAFAVSTDGGKTWNAGMDSSGNAVVNVLSAIGINCDWIHSGTLTLGGINNKNGVLKVVDANGTRVGYWDKDGIVVQKGTISGPSITAGGKNNQSGVISVLDQNNNQVVRLDKDGVDVQRGKIKGAVITLGGVNDLYGLLELLGPNGEVIIKLNRYGVYSTGQYVCESVDKKRRVSLNNGSLDFSDTDGVVSHIESSNANGNRRIQIYPEQGNSISKYLSISINELRAQFKNIVLRADNTITEACNTVEVQRGGMGYDSKSGRAVFSDGSYLDFQNGRLVGGRTADGGTI